MSDTKVGYRGGYEQKEREGKMSKNKLIWFLWNIIKFSVGLAFVIALYILASAGLVLLVGSFYLW